MSFTDDEAPPTVVPDGMVSVEQSVSAIDWLMYGHCLTRESSPPLAPVRLAMENDRARWHSVARGSPRRYGHRPRKRDGDTRVKSIWCGRKILGRIRRPLEFPACAELNYKPRCPPLCPHWENHTAPGPFSESQGMDWTATIPPVLTNMCAVGDEAASGAAASFSHR